MDVDGAFIHACSKLRKIALKSIAKIPIAPSLLKLEKTKHMISSSSETM